MIIGVSKRKAGEETGWKPVCRDRRGRLSSQCLACQNGRQAKKQAGSLFAGTGEDACLPKVAGEETGWKPVCRDHRVAGQTGEDACLPMVASEETGWKPVCRDHRVAGQAGGDAWLPQ